MASARTTTTCRRSRSSAYPRVGRARDLPHLGHVRIGTPTCSRSVLEQGPDEVTVAHAFEAGDCDGRGEVEE